MKRFYWNVVDLHVSEVCWVCARSDSSPHQERFRAGRIQFHRREQRSNTMDHMAFGDTAMSRCQYYRRVCDLPAVIDPPELGRIIVKAGRAWAITMPAVLGRAVQADLDRRAARWRAGDIASAFGSVVVHDPPGSTR